MGLNKKLHTKMCEGAKLSVAERRFGGLEPYPTPKKKSTKKRKKVANDEFVADMLKDLL
jgi:hypothetical protein